MKSNVKIAAPKSTPAATPVATPVATNAVKEELPESAASASKYTDTTLSADAFDAFLAEAEELRTMPEMAYKVDISPKSGCTFLWTRHNGVRIEVYAAIGCSLPDGLVAGATVKAAVSYKKNDGVKDKTSEDGRRFITVFAVNCEIA